MPLDIKSIVVSRPDEGVRSSYAITYGSDRANFMVQALSPLRVIAIRTARVYVQSVLGFLSAGMTGFDQGMLPNDFQALFMTACRMSIAIAVVTAVQNFLELLKRLDQTHPELRA